MMRRFPSPLLALALAAACGFAQAVTLRVADVGDVQSMDPHSLNKTLQLSFTGNIYEALVARGKDMKLVPALATQWKQTAPTVWRFDLRRGVQFHDGTPFGVEDVLFSFKRGAADGSDMKGYTAPIKDVRAVGDSAVEIETNAPFPILPDTLTSLYMMSKRWCEDNKAERPVDRRKGVENAASFRANGTGPICQAVAANPARIGVKVNLQTESKNTYFPKILRRDTSFYLLGWTPSTTDAHDAMYNLMSSPTEKGQGQFNLGSYSSAKFDELAAKVQSETDAGKRNDAIREAFKLHQDDIGHIPLHQQALAWAMKNEVSLVQLPDNRMFFKCVKLAAK